jgi:2-oxoglutarate dehydrogenase E2 component (dihydrolipoamide succinyltransferase)
MADVIMPQMGESIAEGTVTKWLKAVGDTIERDEPLFEISTDKVDAEIPSPAAGVLREIRVPPGTTVEVNTVVALIEEAGSTSASAEPAAADSVPAEVEANAAPTAEPPEPVQQPLAVDPPRPVPAPPAAPSSPDSLPPVSYQIEDDRPRAVPRASPEPAREMTAEELRQSRSSPVVRKIAAEHDVDISSVAGTGIGGRVTKQDILEHIDRQASPPATPSPTPPPAAAAPPPAMPTPTPLRDGRVDLVPMSPIRKKTAEHMVLSKRTSAHVSTVFEVDMTRVDELRKKHRQSWEQASGVRLTFLPFILKAVVDALKSFPILNARVDGDAIAYHKDINLGVAVALDWGLIVPVIHRADEKNLLGLARAVNDIADRARAKKLRVEEVQGGTFTLTNPGVFGSLFGTPIINQPQVAILGTGAIEKRPVVRDDAIAIRTMAYFALTFDHRIVDGSDADRFMAQIKKSLQEFDEAAL